MKLIITRDDGSQLTSIKWNGGELKINTVIDNKYKITKFVKIVNHYLIFNGVEI